MLVRGKNITHIICFDDTNLRRGQVNSKSLLPVWQKLPGKKVKVSVNQSHSDSVVDSRLYCVLLGVRMLLRLLNSYQGEVIRVNPDNTEVRVVIVIFNNLLQDVKELKTI